MLTESQVFLFGQNVLDHAWIWTSDPTNSEFVLLSRLKQQNHKQAQSINLISLCSFHKQLDVWLFIA